MKTEFSAYMYSSTKMHNPKKSSYIDKVSAKQVQEKSSESNTKNFHTSENRKDFSAKTFIKNQATSVQHNIAVVKMVCKDFHNIEFQGNTDFLDKELLNSKIRNAFAILKPSKVLPLHSQTNPRTEVSEKTMNFPLSRYKRHDKSTKNQNSLIPIEKHEPGKYKRDMQRVAQRPLSQNSRSKIEKYIEAFETNGYFFQKRSGEGSQSFSLNVKGENAGKYERQQKRFTDRPYSETSCMEIRKYLNSFESKNQNSNFQESRELDKEFNFPGREKNIEDPGRQQIQLLQKSHSLRHQDEMKINQGELDKHSQFQASNCDRWVQDKKSDEPVEEKKQEKYKRSQHRLPERPYSQPSKAEIENYIKTSQKLKNSLILVTKSRNKDLEMEVENMTPFTKERNSEKYRRNSQFHKAPSQMHSSRIQEYVRAFESKKKAFQDSDFEQLEFGAKKQDQNGLEPDTNSVQYKRHQTSSTKKSFQIVSAEIRNSVDSYEPDDQRFIPIMEKPNKSPSKSPNSKSEQSKQKYSRRHQQNNRSVSAPTVFIQTNVPNYFEYSRVDYDFAKKKTNPIKESKETEEAQPVELKRHDISKRKATNTSLLTSSDIILHQDQNHLKNGYSQSRSLQNKEGKGEILESLSLQSVFNRRPSKKTDEDIQDYGITKRDIERKSQRYSPISQRQQKEKPATDFHSKSLHKSDANFDMKRNTESEMNSPKETEGIFGGNKEEMISKANKFQQDNNKTNFLLLDNVQTNANFYYLKLSHGKKSPAIKKEGVKETLETVICCKNNMSDNSSMGSLSTFPRPECEIPQRKYRNAQNGIKSHFERLSKDIFPQAGHHELSKKKKSFFAYHHCENSEPESPVHSLDEESSQNVPETNVDHFLGHVPQDLDSSIGEMSSPVKDGKNQSSENEMGPAKLDWSISEISIVENVGDAEEVIRDQWDRRTLTSPCENDTHQDVSCFLEESKITSSDSVTEFSRQLKRSSTTSQLSQVSEKKIIYTLNPEPLITVYALSHRVKHE